MTLTLSPQLSFPLPLLELLVGALAGLYLLFLRRRTPLSRLPYMPGPPVTSLISGNASQIPQAKPWLTYIEWGKKYASDIVHFRIYNQHTIILNSYDDCVELLERRSNVYSDRPHNVMLNDLMGWDFLTSLKPYGKEWRAHRRVHQQLFKPDAALKYRAVQTRKVEDFLCSLLTSPAEFMNHYRTLSGAIIMSAMYGLEIAPKDDYYVGIAEAAIAALSESVFPGAVAVNALPFLRHLPSWFPGAGFKRFGYKVSKLTKQMQEVPMFALKKQFETDNIPSCAGGELLASNLSKEKYDEIVEILATAYTGGADTTTSSMGTFFLAMIQYPEVQKRAQEEIDLIVGQDRLITYDDRNSLLYLEALYREVLRWIPVTPLGVSHFTSDDDTYKGCYIPKGMAMAHNPLSYPEHNVFNPKRFLTKDGQLNKDQCTYVFGFGRRICPGRHMASATIWLAIATVLQTFNINKQNDILGNEIPVSGEVSDGLISHVLPYECSITPRNKQSAQLILQAVEKGV